MNVNLAQSTSGPKTALLRDADVTLPRGLELGAQVAAGADGLVLCDADEFGKATPLTAAACLQASAAGTVEIISPLIERPLVGKVFLGEQTAIGELPQLYVEAAFAGATAADAPRIKLVGEVSAAADGAITTRFENNPELRFSQLRLRFPGGDNALFVTAPHCGTYSGSSTLSPWSGTAPVTTSSTLAIDEGCTTAFAPTVGIEPSNSAAGASAPTKIVLERPDRAAWLDDIAVSLPPGFLADLNVPTECTLADAAAASCDESSRIGTVTTVAGAGDDPLTLNGKIYLTERTGTDVAGASIVVRAKLGDLDLGNVIVPGRIELRPADAGLIFRSDVPTRHLGVALQLRKIVVNLDREGFALNPTACGPLPASASIAPDQGAVADVSTQVAYTGCAERPFAPAITAEATGENVAGGHPTLKVEIATRPGDSNLKSTAVTLPLGLSTDLKNVQVRCLPAAFQAAACEPVHRVGSVVATVSITKEQIPGDVYLIDVPGETLPGLGLNFTGRFAQRVGSTVRFVGDRVQATFPAIPDLPLTKLSLTVDGGARSPILRSVRCSAATSSWDTAFIAQGGQTHAASQPTACQGVPAATKPEVKRATVKLSASRKTGLKLTVKDLGTRKLQSLKLTAPGGKKFVASALKKSSRIKARFTGVKKPKIKVTRGSILLQSSAKLGGSAASLTLDRRGSAVTSGKRPKKGSKVSFKLRLAFTDGTTETKTLRITAPR